MNHTEAVEKMTVERYLLGELDPLDREEFEEHMFICPDCALDSRVASVFIEEAKAQLGEIAPSRPDVRETGGRGKGWDHWFSWLRPAFAAPLFALLLLVVGYQNLVTFPALRTAADQPAIAPVASLSGATRGNTHATVVADRAHGIALPVDLPLDPALGDFVSYSFELYNPQGKLAWSGALPAPAQSSTGDLQLSVVLRGRMLEDGTYSVSIFGTGTHGERTPLEHYVFDVTLTK
ncbi:MAG TPA: zf-HC2 domain-containing protein [Terracidiphilus sp.]|nr:zf-HC2 domain-containing protein [Terracidiphilus sp.]